MTRDTLADADNFTKVVEKQEADVAEDLAIIEDELEKRGADAGWHGQQARRRSDYRSRRRRLPRRSDYRDHPHYPTGLADRAPAKLGPE